ncbi:MAG: hypothetical protein HQK55_06075 [Deltaproteobacteria bacterium]|nr:hypothetical protein [Deltaproteobacteria bacterium]
MTERRISIRIADGSTIPANIEIKEQDANCRLHLIGDGIDEAATGPDYFESFTEIRRRLARRNIFPLCYGASKNVWPSGMARDMLQGLAAYRLKLGFPAKENDLVDIFANAPDIEPVTPEEQRAFSDAWHRSLVRKSDSAKSDTFEIWKIIGGLILITLFIMMIVGTIAMVRCRGYDMGAFRRDGVKTEARIIGISRSFALRNASIHEYEYQAKEILYTGERRQSRYTMQKSGT